MKNGERAAMERPVREAVERLERLQEMVLEKQTFRGFSGRARAAGGLLALLAAAAMASGLAPRTVPAHLAAWGAVLVAALALNFGALAHAFLRDPSYRRTPARMRPALDVVPPLAVGGGLTLALVGAGQHDLLFGAWMGCYGLAHLAARRALPPANCAVGLFYLASAALQLLPSARGFLNPWPMALAFVPGELAGGWILHAIRARPQPTESPA